MKVTRRRRAGAALRSRRLRAVLAGAALAGASGLAPAAPPGSVRFPTLTPGAAPAQIAIGPDGNMWFTEHDADRIARETRPAP